MTRAGALAALGLWCGHALAAVRLDAQRALAHTQADSTFLLVTGNPARAPSPFIGNGRIGLVIPALGIGAEPSLVAGLFEHGPGDVPRIAAVPAWNGIAIFDGAHWLRDPPAGDSIGDSIAAYHQTIDMRSGTARTAYEWRDGDRRTGVRVETFISRAAPGIAAARLELTPGTGDRIRVRFGLAGWPRPKRVALARLTRVAPDWGPIDLWYPGHSVVRSRAAEARGAQASLTMTSSPEGRTTLVAQAADVGWPADLPGATAHTGAAGDSAIVEIAFHGAAGRTYTFTLLVGTASSLETTQTLAVARRRAAEARAAGYDAVAAASAAAWERRWRTDIVLEGDPALQRITRAMLFYLLCSADSGTGLAIPPMGLSSGGYYGHMFWDSDTWMFPALVLTHPDIARSLVSFRARALPAARARARAHGFRGAMYPWESDELGRETTPRFAAQNASSEIHVNGDVAVAQWQYYLASGDSAWLAREGFPVLRGTADFWVSRSTFDSVGGQYHIRNVVSVAEGLVGVDDDAYTNEVARRTLELAASAARRLGVPPDPRWNEVAAKLHVPIDSATGSYRTYEGAPDSTLGMVTPLLAYPLGVPMPDSVKRKHLDQVMAHLPGEAAGVMMGITLLSVDAAELGDRRLVDSLLPYSYRNHLKGPFLLPSETTTNNAVSFLTGAGGFLQQVIFGYSGLRLGEHGLEPSFAPVLPSRIRRMVLRNVQVRGRRYDVVVDSSGRHIRAAEAAAPR
jgi:trehalose/maltose hydrolase-like predicted phosphorylase